MGEVVVRELGTDQSARSDQGGHNDLLFHELLQPGEHHPVAPLHIAHLLDPGGDAEHCSAAGVQSVDILLVDVNQQPVSEQVSGCVTGGGAHNVTAAGAPGHLLDSLNQGHGLASSRGSEHNVRTGARAASNDVLDCCQLLLVLLHMLVEAANVWQSRVARQSVPELHQLGQHDPGPQLLVSGHSLQVELPW